MDFQKEYQKWLDSGVLTATEKAELEAIKDAPKEIESRFYGPLEFGTAGLRGTMAVGLHHMNLYVVRHATQAFADIICAEGDAAKEKGVAICMDCRNHGMEFAQAAAEVHQRHRQPQPQGVQRLQSLLGGRRAAAAPARLRYRRPAGGDRHLHWHQDHAL